MPPLMNLPSYQINNALLDFAPLNAGVDSYRKGQEDVRRFGVAQEAGNALLAGDYKGAMATSIRGDRADIAGVAMQARAADTQDELHKYTLQRAKIDGVGRMAQAAISETNPAKREAMRQHILSQHPDKDLIQRFPIYGTDQGLTLLAAESGHALNKLDEDFKRSQIELNRAKAGATNALANVRDGRAAPEAPDPAKGWGMDEDGNLVPLRGPAIKPAIPVSPNALYGTTKAPDELPSDIAPQMAPSGEGRFSPRSNPYGQAGRSAETVPGVVVDAKGKPSPYASKELAGQQALEGQDADRRSRLLANMERRQALEQVYGKPPSGKRWNEAGGLEDLSVKDTATERAGRMHAAQGIQTLDEAEKILGKTYWSQYTGDTYKIPGTGVAVGGFGEAGRGFRAAESAVLQLNFALSGKSVSNAEREEFQRLYRPSAMDSVETQKWKLNEARKFFKTVLDARKKGMDDDRIAELYRQQIAEGTAGAPGQKDQPKNPALSGMATDDLLKRLR